VPFLSQLTSCTPTKSLAAAAMESALYRLLTFHVPSLMSFSFALVAPKYQSRSEAYSLFHNMIRFYGEELLATCPTPKLEYYPLSAVRYCLINIFTATFHIGGRSSIRNLRTRHAVVTRTHISPRVVSYHGNIPVEHLLK